MQTFEQVVTGKFFVSVNNETIDGTVTWPIWEVLGVCSGPENTPIREGGATPYRADLVILREMGGARIDLRTAHDFRTDGYLFDTTEAAAAYAQRCAREDVAEAAAYAQRCAREGGDA